jgi:hypothetical protein
VWKGIKYRPAAAVRSPVEPMSDLLLTSHIEVTRLNQNEFHSNRVSITPGDFSAEMEEYENENPDTGKNRNDASTRLFSLPFFPMRCPYSLAPLMQPEALPKEKV